MTGLPSRRSRAAGEPLDPAVARSWAEAEACLEQALTLCALGAGVGLHPIPLWNAASLLLDLVRSTAAPLTTRRLRACDQAFWRHAELFAVRLAQARAQAETAEGVAAERCRAIERAVRAADDWPAPGAGDALRALDRAMETAAAKALGAGLSGLRVLGEQPLGSARSRIARRLGRDRTRTFRDGDRARRFAMAFAEPAVPWLSRADRAYDDDRRAAVRELDDAVARQSAALTAARASAAAVRPDLAPVPECGAAGLGGRERRPGFPAAEAAAGSVLALPRDNRRLWLTAPHSYRRDLITVFGRRGFVVRRDTLVRRLERAWRDHTARRARTAARALAALKESPYGRNLAQLDALPQAWRRALADEEARAAADLATVRRVGDELGQVSARLAAARAAWEEPHREEPGGLTAATRACLAALRRVAAGHRVPQPVLSDLAALSEGRTELRIPLAGPLNSGKSTLLCALLGSDLTPHPAQPMTVLPTRFVLTGAVGQAEPVLTLSPGLLAGYRELTDALTARLTDPELPDPGIGGQPRLARLARELAQGEAMTPGRSHPGARAVTDVLTRLNDTVRLALLVLPPGTADLAAHWTPEVVVPMPGITGGGRLVLIDTPSPSAGAADDPGPDGQNTTGSALAAFTSAVLAGQLAAAHGCLVVVDYTQLGSTAAEGLARLVGRYAAGFDPRAVVVAVNRIDQRGAVPGQDLGPQAVHDYLRDGTGLPADADPPVFETFASLGLAARRRADGGDRAALDELLALTHPFGAPSDGELPQPGAERLVAAALRRAGTDALRAALLERASRVPELAVDNVLARLTALRGPLPSELVEDVRWAMGRAVRRTG